MAAKSLTIWEFESKGVRPATQDASPINSFKSMCRKQDTLLLTIISSTNLWTQIPCNLFNITSKTEILISLAIRMPSTTIFIYQNIK